MENKDVKMRSRTLIVKINDLRLEMVELRSRNRNTCPIVWVALRVFFLCSQHESVSVSSSGMSINKY